MRNMFRKVGGVYIWKNANCPVSLLNKDTDNVGYRVAYMVSVLDGDNKVKRLKFYNDSITARSDNGEEFKGAYGPRLCWWVGADQYAEAIKHNADIDDVKQMCKPQGISQLKMCYIDLSHNGLDTSTFTIRDPSIDFEGSNDIPGLASGTFSKESGKLNLTLFYEVFEQDIETLWFFTKYLQAMAFWLYLLPGEITVVAVDYEIEDLRREDYPEVEYPIIDLEPHDYWKDIEELAYFENNLRMMLSNQSLGGSEVEVNKLIDMLETAIEGREGKDSKFYDDTTKDLARALVMWSLYNTEVEFDELRVIPWLETMSTAIKYEVASMVTSNTVNFDVSDVADGILGEL